MNKKIDYRHNYIINFDSETANGLDDPLAYDFSWIVMDTNGTIYETRAYVNSDIFLDEKEMMQTAYYKEKIPQYWEDIKSGNRKLATLYTIRKVMLADIEKYHIKVFMAHNARFDVMAINTTLRYETKSKHRYFLPKGIEVWDTMLMARSVVGKMPTYRKFCESNGYTYGKNGNQLRMTAEVLYRYITKNTDFIEEHKGLEDVMIEKEIFLYCKRQHKSMRKVLYGG